MGASRFFLTCRLIFLPWLTTMILPWLLLLAPIIILAAIVGYGVYIPVRAFRAKLAHKQDLRVLLVDDDPAAGLLVKNLFKRRSAIVDVYADPKKAIRSLKKFSYDLVVLDYAMPRLNGVNWIRLADRIFDKSSIAHRDRTPIVIYSQDPAKFFPCLNQSNNFFCRDIWHKAASFTEILAKANSLVLA